MPEPSAVPVAAASVSVAEQESEQSGAVGVVTTRHSAEGVLADPESSLSDVTDSPPESDYEEEAESESSDHDRGEFEQSDSQRESTSVPVPVTVFDRMDDSDKPDPEMVDPKPEPTTVVSYNPDIVVKE